MVDRSPAAVSCLALTFFTDYCAAHDVDPSPLFEGLPYTRAYLADRTGWVDYPTFLEVERRMADLFPGQPDLYFTIGTTFPSTEGLGFLRVLVRSVLSPSAVYGMIPRLVPRYLFPFVEIEFTRTDRTHLRGTYAFAETHPPSDAFLDTVRGILTAIPTILGAPAAEVQLTHLAGEVFAFDVTLNKVWLGPLETVRNLLRRVGQVVRLRRRTLDDAVAEMKLSNALLEDKVVAVTEAKSELDRKVRDLTLLHRLAAATSQDLDLERTVASAVEVIALERRLPAGLVLEDGGVPVLAAWSAFEPVALAAAETAASGGRLTVDRPMPIELGGQAFLAVPLPSRQVAGALLVGLGSDVDADQQAVLSAAAGQIGVALDNAHAVQMIHDLHDNLERRVQERTAQLEEARVELEDTIVSLERADQARQAFFMNVSHELKTPLTLILAPLDEVRPSTPQDEVLVDGIRRNAHHLRGLVEELLDFSRLDAGRMTLRPEPFDLAGLVDDVVTTLRPLADRKGVHLLWEPSARSHGLDADPRLTQRVLVNLVGNAVKYIDAGDTIEVRVGTEQDTCWVEIADDGPGIAAEDADKVFERFHRAWNDSGRIVEGSGIGLAMAREIADLHGGSLVLDTDVGKGCRFRLTLPGARSDAPSTRRPRTEVPAAMEHLREPAPVSEAPPATDVGRHERVLLVEDNPEMRGFLQRLLQNHFRVSCASDGVEALATAERDPPDLVLSDVQMPHMDGLELCRRLKGSSSTRNLPVVLLSAGQGVASALAGFDAGADDYVVKPFSAPELVARLRAQLRLRALTVALLRSEKQAQLGVMAAGIAHEVRNPLNAVINALGPLERMLLGPDPTRHAASIRSLLGVIADGGHRIRNVVDAMLTLARHDEGALALTEVVLPDRIRSVLALVEHRVGPGVEVVLEADDRPVQCYADLLDQVLLNLVANALDAVGDQGRVEIKIASDADTTRVEVTDDGPGVPPEVRDRVFLPFFTTKGPGSGVGLGLCISREIMDLHGGALELEPSDRGARFVVTLPRRDHRPEVAA